MQVLAVLNAPAIFTDEILAGLDILHMVRLTLEYGVSPASSYALGYFGIILGHYYHRYGDGYRFGALAREVVKRHEFTAFETKTLFTLELVSIWSQPLTAAVDAVRAAFFTGVESGDLTITCFANSHIGSEMLARGDRLDEVWNETKRSLAFAEKAQFRDVAMLILGTQRFIETMRGRTFSLESFDGEGFDEAAFEEELSAPGRMSTMVCWYWLIKGQARLICGDVDQAEDALERSRELFWSSAPGHVQNIDYHFFSALTLAALEARGPPQESRQDRLEVHRAQLGRWRDSSPSTFSGKCALVAAEVARAEGRDADAIRLYDEAVQASRRYGFLQDEAIANELAAHFYAARGAETISRACAREARHAYLRWGALGKVRQLEQLDPRLREEPAAGPRATIDAPVEDLDWGTVVKLSQALSSEILLDKWMKVLMTLSLEHAGAERGALLVPRAGELQVVAEAASAPLGIEVFLHPARAAVQLPESLLRYVSRTRERVLLDDASSTNPFAADAYFVREVRRSVLCLPLVKQGELIGLLYLENNLSPRIFTPGRSALLELVASHAAVSLDHAQLFAQLEQRLAFERLISDLSAEIGESPVEALDTCISASLERLSRFLGIERAVLFEFTPESNELQTAAFWCPGQLPPPSTIDGARVPATVEHLRRSEPFCCETPADIPTSDRWVLDRVGMQSFVGLPASVEGVGLGYLFLGVHEPRHWPDEMVQRLRVVADILANALARKHAERDRRIQHELAQALEFRELVMGILGHDLRSPLGAASGLVQLVLRHEGLPEVLRRRVTAVSHSMDRMNDLIGTLLDFTESRFKGGVTIARTAMDLQRACGRVVDEQLADNPGRTIQQHCDGPVEGDWDPVRIEQVLSNLLSNALKHGDPARPVEVTLRSECSDVAVLEVTNFGAPIPSEILGQLFEPFRRGPTAEPGGRRGLGLGLYIVRQIALAHGGSVDVESTSERGTRFSVRLPRNGQATLGPPRRDTEPSPTGERGGRR
ncbi:MAG: ATP-binding protein [Polyangiaceae bacterium]